MSLYVIAVLCALLAPMLYSAANVLDSHLSNNHFKRLTPLIFFTSICYVLLLPISWWLQAPHVPSVSLWLTIFCIALIDVAYQYPYYWSLRLIDTSIVVSLFSLGKIFVPVFAFFLVGEKLTPLEYVGFIVIVGASLLLSLEGKKIKLNHAFALMCGVSLIVALQVTFYKFAFAADGGWSSVFSTAMILECLIMSTTLISRRNRRDVFALFKNRRVMPALIGMELFSFLASICASFALSVIPATIFAGIGSLQALFALSYAELFSGRTPNVFHESLRRKKVRKKVFLFGSIIIGTILVLIK